MKKWTIMAAVVALICGSSASSQVLGDNAREQIGYGYIANNDLFGDGRDRWQSSSIATSRVRGYGWDGDLPDAPGELLEIRFQGRIIAPADVENPLPGDRVYASTWSLGAHTHFNVNGSEFSLGADMVISGPQTGLHLMQNATHELLNRDLVSDTVLNDGVQDGFHPGVVVEYARPILLTSDTQIRPFAELRTGDETLLRSGVDLYLGTVGGNDFLVRDPVTGQRYRAVQGDYLQGYGLMVGGDFTSMQDSIYFPSNGPAMLDSRTRLRAGMVWQGNQNSLFYGLTYLGKEFEGQEEPQLVGSIRLNLEF